EPWGGRLLGEPAPEAARAQRRDVGQHPRQRQPAGAGQVTRLPDRVELLLVLVEALEVVEVLAVTEHQGPQAAPQRRDRPPLETRERRDPEVEPAVAVGAPP